MCCRNVKLEIPVVTQKSIALYVKALHMSLSQRKDISIASMKVTSYSKQCEKSETLKKEGSTSGTDARGCWIESDSGQISQKFNLKRNIL